MNETLNQETSAFVNDEAQYNKKIKSMPKQPPEVGVDLNNTFFDNIINAGLESKLDMSKIESFTQVSQNRNLIYDLIDTMCEDSTIAAVLETYTEDATEPNDNGQIVWAESSDSDVVNYVTYLLDTMNVDKHIYKWVHNLCKYGDVYLRLYRESDHKDPVFKKSDENKDIEGGVYDRQKSSLNEDINVIAYKDNDNYVHYIEMYPNPAEIFELTKFGKTSGYIKAKSISKSKVDNILLPTYRYKFNMGDIDIYDAKTFVHACLEDNSTRVPEEVDIFIDNDDTLKDRTSDTQSYNYTVKRGQSLFYNVFKIWRELMLLENSILLNRISKSSIVRVIGVEVGDMPKEKVGPHLLGIKQLIEQKAAINEGKSMTEYTNPGPIENNIYVPTHNGIGAINTQQVGGDVDVKSLADLDYFKNKYFGALRVPKQYFGDTDDSAGFNGGESLSLISARYAKMIKRIQNTIIQAITDVINLMLLDKGLNTYVNKFTIKMQAPTTSEEKDRRENLSNKIAVVSDIMALLSDVEDTVTKLKILKSLLSTVITDSEVADLLQKEIDRLESEEGDIGDLEDENMDFSDEDNMDFGNFETPSRSFENNSPEKPTEEESSGGELPSPEELGIDMTNNNNADFD